MLLVLKLVFVIFKNVLKLTREFLNDNLKKKILIKAKILINNFIKNKQCAIIVIIILKKYIN